MGLGHNKNVRNFELIAKNVDSIYAKFDMTGAISDNILYLCGDNKYSQLTFDGKKNRFVNVLTDTYDNVKK